jgi:hypothetical protein
VHVDLVISVLQVLLLGPGADWKLPAQLVFAQQVDVEVTVILPSKKENPDLGFFERKKVFYITVTRLSRYD